MEWKALEMVWVGRIEKHLEWFSVSVQADLIFIFCMFEIFII